MYILPTSALSILYELSSLRSIKKSPPASFSKVQQDEIDDDDDDDEGQVPYVCSLLCRLVGKSERERKTKKAFPSQRRAQ